MPTSEAGSKSPVHAARGFTLIELMVVVALIAIATAGVSLALRDSADTALERDAQRLAAVLEATRAQARASDARALWLPREGGFVVQGLPAPQPLQPWLSDQTRAQITAPVVLGPEPLIAPQQIALFAAQQPQRRLWVVTDGLRPFEVQRTPPGSRP
ncbi:Tfp pilus assembly protein FimT/FimU [Limnohabitans sp.]|uniref:pilus assembly FimT family protein n=1 Tax=Limnohabitans sp. TaxID=1907725 RepID=UPI0035B2A207